MKKLSCVAVLALTAALATGAAFAAAPANMLIANNTGYFTNAYIHNVPGEPLGPHNSQFIPWTGPNSVTALCHGSSSMLKDADPCAFEVYLTDDPSNPQQTDFATVTFYVSNGVVVNVNYVTHVHGVKIKSTRPGQFELNDHA